MHRASLISVSLALVCAACGTMNEVETQSAQTDSIPTTSTSPAVDVTTTSSAVTTTRAPTTAEVATIEAATTTEQTIYRPEPIREGDQVVVMIRPVEGVMLDDSSVALRIVEAPDGRFLEADLTNAAVPEGAEFWMTEINGRPRGKSTARQGSTLGMRIDRDVYGDTLLVTFSATTADGAVVATTGEVEVVE